MKMLGVSKEQIAAFRYSLISGVVNRQTPLLQGEITEYFKEIASKAYNIPGSCKTTVSIRTLERYKHLYEKYGYDALIPNSKAISKTRAPLDILKEAELLKRERPERSIEQILYILKESGKLDSQSVSASTISRHFRKSDLSKESIKQEKTKNYGFKRFEAEDIHFIWQSDFQHTLYLPDPSNPGKKKKAMLYAILDDYSRYLVHAQFYWDEKLPCLEDSFKKAILKHGVPERFYCDNGSAFSSHHLSNICGRLGVKLTHSAPYRPQGRGKIERLFRFVDTSFKNEAYLAIESGKLTTLEELNVAFNNWVEGFYHIRKHGSTGVEPQKRLESSKRITRKIPIPELQKIFFYEDTRKVDKTACFSLLNNQYEVDSSLCGKKIVLRYDPFDLSMIEVWLNGKQYENAKPLVLFATVHPKRNQIPKEEKPTENHSCMSFLDAVKKQKEKQWEQITLTYKSEVR